MEIKTYKTAVFKQNGNLPEFIKKHIPALKEKSVLVVSSKLAALREGLIVECQTQKDFENIIKKESAAYFKTSLCYFTVRNGMVMTNAGADRSNTAPGTAVLLPQNPQKSAARLRRELLKIYKLKTLGVILADSMILPLRAGVIGAAVGYSGFKGAQSRVGTKDIYGRKLETTIINYADSLAAAASLLMGEAAEKTPLALITNAPVKFTAKDNPSEIKYPLKDDLYYPFFKGKLKIK